MIDNTQQYAVRQQLDSPVKRHNIINHLIQKHNFEKYLEIGIFDGFTFNQIACICKHGVDPGAEGLIAPQVTHRMTSDDFFEICDESYDIILIDGLHEYKQVIKDFNNSIKHINNNGYIILHDCLPPDEVSQNIPRQSVSWNGDVWKAFILIKEANPHAYVIDTDFGIGIVHHSALNKVKKIIDNVSWNDFLKNKHKLLSLKNISEVKEIL